MQSLENTAEHKHSGLGAALYAVEHDVESAFHVSEALAKGAWDYTVNHTGEVVKTAAITVGTGLLVGGALALFPESLAVGAVLAVGGGALGAVSLGSLGMQTYRAFKDAWPDLEIVADSDHHSKEEVAAAETAVGKKTGAAVTNLALLLPSFVVGNVAGNLGADAVLAATAGPAAAAGSQAAACAATEAAVVETAAVESAEALSATTAAEGVCPVTEEGLAASNGLSAMGRGILNFLNHNPLDELPHPHFWMRLNNNAAFSFESYYWLEKSDLEALRLVPVESSIVQSHLKAKSSQDKTNL